MDGAGSDDAEREPAVRERETEEEMLRGREQAGELVDCRWRRRRRSGRQRTTRTHTERERDPHPRPGGGTWTIWGGAWGDASVAGQDRRQGVCGTGWGECWRLVGQWTFSGF